MYVSSKLLLLLLRFRCVYSVQYRVVCSLVCKVKEKDLTTTKKVLYLFEDGLPREIVPPIKHARDRRDHVRVCLHHRAKQRYSFYRRHPGVEGLNFFHIIIIINCMICEKKFLEEIIIIFIICMLCIINTWTKSVQHVVQLPSPHGLRTYVVNTRVPKNII